MAEEFHSGREVGMAIDAMGARIVALRDQLTDIKWVMGGFATVAVAAFAYFYLITKDLSIAVARIDEHLKSVDTRLDSVDQRLDSIETRMDKRFEAMDRRFEAMDKRFEALESRMDKRFDTLTTLIMNLQPPLKRTEGFTLAPGLGGRQ
jgi:septation ring formation regulator EzrA